MNHLYRGTADLSGEGDGVHFDYAAFDVCT